MAPKPTPGRAEARILAACPPRAALRMVGGRAKRALAMLWVPVSVELSAETSWAFVQPKRGEGVSVLVPHLFKVKEH